MKQGQVADTVGEIRAGIEGLSPEVAKSIGGALDPTQGFNFDPNAPRPAELPEPGSAPGGGPARNQSNFEGNTMADQMAQMAVTAGQGGELPDDRDAVLAAHGVPGGPQQPPGGPGQPPPPGGHGGGPGGGPGATAPIIEPDPNPPVEHTILTKLRQDLGLETVKTRDFDIGGHKWTMTLLAPKALALASRLADTLSEGATEFQMTMQSAVAAYAVVAIDQVPTWQVFGVTPPPGVNITNPLNPPGHMRYLAAARLFGFIHEGSRTQLPQRLWDAYNEEIDGRGGVASQLDQNPRMRFRCQEEQCGHELFIPPRYKPGSRDVILPFCRWHASPMKITAAEESENPLA